MLAQCLDTSVHFFRKVFLPAWIQREHCPEIMPASPAGISPVMIDEKRRLTKMLHSLRLKKRLQV